MKFCLSLRQRLINSRLNRKAAIARAEKALDVVT